MQNIWKYISNLGISGEENQINQRTTVLSNKLNFVMFVTMSLLLVYTIVTLLLRKETIYIGTYRVALMLIVSCLNLVLSRFGYARLSKFSLIFLPPVIFLLAPTLVGFVEEESYTYYPYVVIGLSIIPQILLNPRDEKLLFWFSLLYYFGIVIFIDKLMVYYGDYFQIIDRIATFYPFYKIAHIGLFLFINACIYYLRNLSFRFEEDLYMKNNVLNIQNAELKAQKDEIEQQKDELVNKEISTWQKLVNIISHEIVNSAIPITNLAGISSQMLEDESGATVKPGTLGEEVLDDIHHSLKIIESRTQGLINFVKATKSLTQIPNPTIRTIRVRELLDRIDILFNTRYKDAGVTCEKQIIPPDLSVEADLELIEQVMINLVQNALEAMHGMPGPRLCITAIRNDSSHVQISVSDNGAGINSEVLEKLFLPFYSTKPHNSGIGLSLSQQIMMQHNGRIEVSSPETGGAIFTLTFS